MVQGLNHTVEVEIPNARALLDRMFTALEAYMLVEAPQASLVVVESSESQRTIPTEDVPSVTRSTDELIKGSIVDYKKLRSQAPDVDKRRQVQTGKVKSKLLCKDKKISAGWERPTNLDIERMPVTDEDKVIVARTSKEHYDIYLVRISGCSSDDSGWYIGPSDGTKPDKFEGMTVSDLLKVRPDMKEILTLPTGYFVMMRGNTVKTVIDSHNVIVCSDIESTVGGKTGSSKNP
jgi:hypothetical protein